jgi:dTDP-4-dehydrorhamnose reductase
MCLDLLTGATTGALYSDEFRCPIAVSDLADAVFELSTSDYAGLLNVAGADPVSRPELGRLVARRYGLDATRLPERTLAEAGQIRPANVRLDSTLAASLLRTRLRGVIEYLS